MAGWNLFPGQDSLPFRTRNSLPPSYKRDDPVAKQPVITSDMHVDQFDLSDPEDVKKYRLVIQKCANEKAYIQDSAREYDAEKKSWKILVIWADYFLEDPIEHERDIAAYT